MTPIAVAPRRTYTQEVWLVLGVSLGASALYAVLDIVNRLTAARPLASQQAQIIVSATPGRPWLDLAYQLAGIVTALVPALLAMHLMARDNSFGELGFTPARPLFDLGGGAILAACIGIPGLGIYFAARAVGASAEVVPSALGHVWWAVPVQVLAGIQNAVVEEVIMVGYLVTRLRQIGWAIPAVVATSALIRGSYHLYQGFGGFVGNAIMGVIFVLLFLRYKRVGPLIVAHAVIDTVVFVGYPLLSPHFASLR